MVAEESCSTDVRGRGSGSTSLSFERWLKSILNTLPLRGVFPRNELSSRLLKVPKMCSGCWGEEIVRLRD